MRLPAEHAIAIRWLDVECFAFALLFNARKKKLFGRQRIDFHNLVKDRRKYLVLNAHVFCCHMWSDDGMSLLSRHHWHIRVNQMPQCGLAIRKCSKDAYLALCARA